MNIILQGWLELAWLKKSLCSMISGQTTVVFQFPGWVEALVTKVGTHEEQMFEHHSGMVDLRATF